MKNMKLTKIISLFLVFFGLVFLAGCHQNRIPSNNPNKPDVEVDCEKNPNHENCKNENPGGDQPDKPDTPVQPDHEHILETIPEFKPTCTQAGLTEGKVCVDCGEFVVEPKEVPALGHAFELGKCTVCGADDPDYVPEDEREPEFSFGFKYVPLKDRDTGEVLGYTISGYEGEDIEVRVPNNYQEIPVVKISASAFANNEKITKVIIPDTVQVLDESLFSKCTSLQEVVFDGEPQIIQIPKNAFYKCTSLKKIDIPASVKLIGDYAFYYCSSIAEMYVSTDVIAIGMGAFAGMTSLSKLTVPFIGGGASASADARVLGYVFDLLPTDFTAQISQKINETTTKTYYIPTSLKVIEVLEGGSTYLGYGALSGVSTVEMLILPKTVNRFYDNAFYGNVGISKIYYRGSSHEWLQVTGKHLAGNKAYLDKVSVEYNFEG